MFDVLVCASGVVFCCQHCGRARAARLEGGEGLTPPPSGRPHHFGTCATTTGQAFRAMRPSALLTNCASAAAARAGVAWHGSRASTVACQVIRSSGATGVETGEHSHVNR